VKKSVKLAALVALLALTAWLGMSQRAEAIFSCTYLNGRSCPVNGQTTFCRYADGENLECTCVDRTWWC
jgi:hypothetical protein